MSQFVTCLRPRFSHMAVFLLALSVTPASAGEDRELRIRYSELINRGAVTHSGRTVGDILEGIQNARRLADDRGPVERIALSLAVRPFPKVRTVVSTLDLLQQIALSVTEKSQLALIEPFLETQGFVLAAALIQMEPERAKKPLIEVASLFPPGSKQPAWADLLRTRYFVVLSDGKGYVRVFLPGRKAKRAYETHYGVLRHVLNWLRKSVPGQKLDVEVFAYRNDLVATEFTLNLSAHRVAVNAPLPVKEGLTPLDLDALRRFFESQ